MIFRRVPLRAGTLDVRSFSGSRAIGVRLELSLCHAPLGPNSRANHAAALLLEVPIEKGTPADKVADLIVIDAMIADRQREQARQ